MGRQRDDVGGIGGVAVSEPKPRPKSSPSRRILKPRDRFQRLAEKLDCHDGQCFHGCELDDVLPFLEKAIDRIERAVEKLPTDPGHNYSIAERVERALEKIRLVRR